MNSIHQQQTERNHEDLTGEDAVARIKKTVDEAKTCFFCTSGRVAGSDGIRPMNVRKVDDQGALWFLSSVDSHKNEELEHDTEVVLLFQGSPHSDFLQLNGRASISRDREKIKELWEPMIKTWFTGGVDDPRITVIKVTPDHGYYWDNKHGNLVAGVKMMLGAMTGKTMDDSIEGRVDVPSQARRR
jgi:general stress protein 26